MEGFTLRKSYLDVIDAAGRCAIAYWTELVWGPIAVRWEALSVHEPGRPALHLSALGRGPGPGRVDGAIAWHSAALDCRVTGRPWSSPYGSRLLETEEGSLDWTCQAPAATVALESGDGTAIEGSGYAEELRLSMPPWKLPIAELRWGRWACPATRRSIVWIDWRGLHPLTLVLDNGLPQRDASVANDSIRCGSVELRLADTRDLYTRTLADVLGGIPGLVKRLPGGWCALEDRKSRSVGWLQGESGWAVHELVRFP